MPGYILWIILGGVIVLVVLVLVIICIIAIFIVVKKVGTQRDPVADDNVYANPTIPTKHR